MIRSSSQDKKLLATVKGQVDVMLNSFGLKIRMLENKVRLLDSKIKKLQKGEE